MNIPLLQAGLRSKEERLWFAYGCSNRRGFFRYMNCFCAMFFTAHIDVAARFENHKP